MAILRQTTAIDCGIDEAWSALSDWAGLATRLGRGFVTDARLDGPDRLVTFDNGMTVRERMVGIDEHDRRLVWTVVDGPFTHYNGAARLWVNDNGATQFEWRSDLLPDELAPEVEDMMSRGIVAIKQTLETSHGA